MQIDFSNELHEGTSGRTARSAQVIAPLVCGLVKPASVVDVGCGHGHWLREFMSNGARDILGMDGDYIRPEKLVIPASAFRSVDLTRPQKVERRYDLSMCIEVLEHIPQEFSRELVRYLCGLSDCVLFSAAIPGQPGHMHINAQWPDYWYALFRENGYVGLDFIRPQIWHMEDVLLCHRQNVVFFVHERIAQSDPWKNLPRMNCLTLVDQDTMRELLGVRQSFARIVKKLFRR